MVKIRKFLLFGCLFGLISIHLSSQGLVDYSTVVFKIKNSASENRVTTLASNSNLQIKPFYRAQGKSLGIIDLIFIAKGTTTISPDFIDKLLQSGDVEWAHYKQIPELLYTPNDPLLGSQYYLSLMQAYSAWDITLGSHAVTVGIVDTGTDPNHPDLINRFAYNQADPINGIDDDFDGFVDNYLGWNVAENNNQVSATENPHGVGICGIVAAQANNSFGMAGIAPGVKILPVKIMDQQGLLTASYEGILYAAEKGCDIIVCSWGSTIPDQLSATIVEYVLQNYPVIIVAAAGNSKNENRFYPASYPGVVSVLATNQFDHKWVGSSYGYHIDLAAPGQNILSTAFGGGFSTTSGSSNAAPMVAGLAALVKSARPHLTPEQIVAQIKAASVFIDTLPANIPYANKLGAGRINMFTALNDTTVFYPKIPEQIISAEYVFPNQTILINAQITNVLQTKNNIFVVISPLSEYVSITNGTLLVPHWQGQQTIDFSQFNINLSFAGNLPYDLEIPVRFTFFSGNRTHQVIRIINSPKSWYDLSAFSLKMTLAANGKPGFHTLSPQVGYGFRKSGSGNFLWDAGIIAGNSADNIVTNIVGLNDFMAFSPVHPTITSTKGTARATFSENPEIEGLNCEYRVEIETGSQYPFSEAVIYKITVINNNRLPVSDLRIGLFTSWLIYRGAMVSYNPELKLATFRSSENYPYVHGIALLSADEDPQSYSFDTNENPQGINITDDFTRSEMWQALNESHDLSAPLSTTIPANLLSSGTYSIPPQDSVEVRFVFLTDYHEALIESHLHQLRQHLSIPVNPLAGHDLFFPNPVKNLLHIPVETTSIELINIDGRRTELSPTSSPIYVGNIPSGIYLIKLQVNNRTVVQKIVITE